MTKLVVLRVNVYVKQKHIDLENSIGTCDYIIKLPFLRLIRPLTSKLLYTNYNKSVSCINYDRCPVKNICVFRAPLF